MFHDQSEQYLERKLPPYVAMDLSYYKDSVGAEKLEKLKQLALPLENKVSELQHV